MIIDQCPHCGTRHVQTEDQFKSTLDPRSGEQWWHVVRCQNPACMKLVLAHELNNGTILGIYPSGTYDLDSTVPLSQEIRGDFREAGLCLGAGCFKASLTMSRRVLQRILKEQGCTQNKLVDAINHAISSGLLRKSFHAVAEEIRQYGNLGAHPDDDQLANANRENAALVLEFARLLVQEFYEVPASAGKLKAARQNSSAP